MSYTYTTLKQAIKDYTENDETTFVNNLPVFIRNTEERVLKNVQLSLFQRNASGVMSNAKRFLNSSVSRFLRITCHLVARQFAEVKY